MSKLKKNQYELPSKSDVGLGNVDNTSDLDKPLSTATSDALLAKFDKLSIGGSQGRLISGDGGGPGSWTTTALGANGTVLTADNTAAGGLKWAVPTGGGVTDHGALTGLGDDDHPQYWNRNAEINNVRTNFFDRGYYSRANLDPNNRFEIFTDGYMKFGPGNLGVDTFFWRSNTAELRTNGRFVAEGGLTSDGTINGLGIGVTHTAVITADVSTSSLNANVNLTGLVVDIIAGHRYAVEFCYVYTTSVVGTDAQFSFNGTGLVGFVSTRMPIISATTSNATIRNEALSIIANVTMPGLTTEGTNQMYRGHGIVTAPSSTTLQSRYSAMTAAGNLTVRAGSYLSVTRIA